MGQAKSRGSREDRVKQAVERQQRVDAIETPRENVRMALTGKRSVATLLAVAAVASAFGGEN